MKKFAIVLCTSFAVLMSLSMVTGNAAFFAEKEVVTAISKHADAVGSGKVKDDDLMKAGAKLASGPVENDIYLAMELFSLRKSATKGGVGIGAIGSVDKEEDGIDKFLDNMKKEWDAAKATKLQKPLMRASEITAAVATVTYHAPVAKAKGKSDWKKWSMEMLKYSKDLRTALDKKDFATAKTVTKKLHDSCVECHTKYRGE